MGYTGGTMFQQMEYYLKEEGIGFVRTSPRRFSDIQRVLDEGSILLVTVDSGRYYNNGADLSHFLLVYGYEMARHEKDHKLLIHDPYSARSSASYSHLERSMAPFSTLSLAVAGADRPPGVQ